MLDALITEHRPAIEAMAHSRVGMPTFFEALTALAIRHFADVRAQWALMEAGLGGVTDATNVFQAPQARSPAIFLFIL